MTLKAEIENEDVRRNYSLCVAPQDGTLTVTVKRIAGGLFSNWANDRLKPGDAIEVMPPHGSFTTDFDASKPRHLVGIAGGSGITPVMSLIKSTLKYEPGSRFTLLYGNRDSNSVIFLEALAALKDKHLGRLEIYHFLDAEEQDIELFNGMLDRARCEEAIEHLVPDAAEVDGWFICGPGPMMDAAEGVLLDRNIPKERIHIERLTADRPPEAALYLGTDRLERHRRQTVLQGQQVMRGLVADEVGAGGERLAELDRRRADRLERRGVVGHARLEGAEAGNARQPADLRRGVGIGLDPSQRPVPGKRPPPLQQTKDMGRGTGQIFHPEWIATSPPRIGSTFVFSKPAARIIRSNSGIGGKRRIDSIR